MCLKSLFVFVLCTLELPCDFFFNVLIFIYHKKNCYVTYLDRVFFTDVEIMISNRTPYSSDRPPNLTISLPMLALKFLQSSFTCGGCPSWEVSDDAFHGKYKYIFVSWSTTKASATWLTESGATLNKPCLLSSVKSRLSL